jgi:hypothetical protein
MTALHERNKTKLLSLAVLSFLAVALSLNTAAAQNFSVRTSNPESWQFIYDADPGETFEEKIFVKNNGAEKMTLNLYGADGIISQQGSFSAKTPDQVQRNVGKWIQVETASVELEPGEEKEVNVAIAIPKETPGGVYAGAISVSSSGDKPGEENGGYGLVTVARVLIPVKISLSGEKIHRLDWQDFSYRFQNDATHQFNVKFKNSGNTSIMLDGQIEVFQKDGNGNLVAPAAPAEGTQENIMTVNELNLLPGDELDLPFAWKDRPFMGEFTAKASITYSEIDIITGEKTDTQTLEKTVEFSVFPYKLVKNVAMVLALLVLLAVVKIVYDMLQKKNTQPYVVQANETLEIIAGKIGTRWKLIAKINNLKPPYSLKEGQNILVPKTKTRNEKPAAS